MPVELDWNEGEFFTSPEKDFIICATHGACYVASIQDDCAVWALQRETVASIKSDRREAIECSFTLMCKAGLNRIKH